MSYEWHGDDVLTRYATPRGVLPCALEACLSSKCGPLCAASRSGPPSRIQRQAAALYSSNAPCWGNASMTRSVTHIKPAPPQPTRRCEHGGGSILSRAMGRVGVRCGEGGKCSACTAECMADGSWPCVQMAEWFPDRFDNEEWRGHIRRLLGDGSIPKVLLGPQAGGQCQPLPPTVAAIVAPRAGKELNCIILMHINLWAARMK